MKISKLRFKIYLHNKNKTRSRGFHVLIIDHHNFLVSLLLCLILFLSSLILGFHLLGSRFLVLFFSHLFILFFPNFLLLLRHYLYLLDLLILRPITFPNWLLSSFLLSLSHGRFLLLLLGFWFLLGLRLLCCLGLLLFDSFRGRFLLSITTLHLLNFFLLFFLGSTLLSSVHLFFFLLLLLLCLSFSHLVKALLHLLLIRQLLFFVLFN